MSNDNWWRSSSKSSTGIENRGDNAWPCLSPSRRRPIKQRAKVSHNNGVEENTNEESLSVKRSTVMDYEGYPELGQGYSKRKTNISQNPLAGCSEKIDSDKLTIENKEVKNFSKKCRRTELICIELKHVLERQRSLSESQASSSSKPRIKLNSNLSIRNPLDSSEVISCRKGKQLEIPRAKRISKLKRVIFKERQSQKLAYMMKRDVFDMAKLQSLTCDVSEIDFGKLKISGDSKSDVKFMKDMSVMKLFDDKQRKAASGYLPNDNILESNANEVVSKLQNLLIHKDPADKSPEIDNGQESSFHNNKASCVKVCDETGETVEEFDKPNVKSSSVVTKNLSQYSKNFREYCTNDLTPRLNKASEEFLADIYRLQKRMYERDEVKGRTRRRFYAGFKQTLKHVESGKIRFVFIAPDLEGAQGYPGGLTELVATLISACKKRHVVFCFSSNKRKLGYYIHKKGIVSCVGITNYAGLEDLFETLLLELMAARTTYAKLNGLEDPGFEALSPVANQWNLMLLSTRINLLFKHLAITGRRRS